MRRSEANVLLLVVSAAVHLLLGLYNRENVHPTIQCEFEPRYWTLKTHVQTLDFGFLPMGQVLLVLFVITNIAIHVQQFTVT